MEVNETTSEAENVKVKKTKSNLKVQYVRLTASGW